MPCTPVSLENGGRAIVCGGPRARRCACGSGRSADRLCDWKVPTRRSGTCDRKLCSSCTSVPAADKDLCADHAAEWAARQARTAS